MNRQVLAGLGYYCLLGWLIGSEYGAKTAFAVVMAMAALTSNLHGQKTQNDRS